MSIVLNETEWAEERIRNKELGRKPFETLTRVARYYLDNGYNKDGARTMVEKFILQCEPSASIPKWADTIKYALEKAIKNKAIDIPGIPITKNELSAIESVNGVQMKRLAFTLLCLAKFRDLTTSTADHWVNTKDSEIMAMANINTSVKRQSKMYHDLNELGLIQFSKKVDNTNVRVLFIGNDDQSMLVSDFRNLGNQYMMLLSDKYIRCSNCGAVVRKENIVDTLYEVDHTRQRYCKQCSAEIKMRRNIERTMRVKFKPASPGD